jgi:hypothetical protein
MVDQWLGVKFVRSRVQTSEWREGSTVESVSVSYII